MMKAVEFALGLYLNLNIVLVIGWVLWCLLHQALKRSPLRQSYAAQLGVLRVLVVLVVLSPLLAIGTGHALGALSPDRSVVLSDMIVASFLRGEIAMDAVRFEQLLNMPASWMNGLVALQGPVFVGIVGGFMALSVFFLARFARAAWQLYRILEHSFLWKRIGPVDVRLSDSLLVPMAARGLWRRHVILPADLVTRKEDCRIALAHELQHFRQGDMEWEVAFEVARSLFFWNPAFALLKGHFDRLRELSCDQAVIARRRVNPLDYARCLLGFCERSIGVKQPQYLRVALVATGRRSNRTELARRLLSLKSPIAPRRPARALAAGLVCVLGLAISLSSATLLSPSDWSHDRLMLSTVVNLERMEAYNQGF